MSTLRLEALNPNRLNYLHLLSDLSGMCPKVSEGGHPDWVQSSSVLSHSGGLNDMPTSFHFIMRCFSLDSSGGTYDQPTHTHTHTARNELTLNVLHCVCSALSKRLTMLSLQGWIFNVIPWFVAIPSSLFSGCLSDHLISQG